MNDKNEFLADLSLYKQFYLVCHNGSFSKTANILGVTQPSISYNIKKLEDELGVMLFERSTTLIMTPEAQELLPYVEEAFNNIRNGERKISDLLSLKTGQISIGIPSHIGVFFLTNILKKFNLLYPHIKVKVVCKTTNELFRLLSLNDLDIVIDSSPLPDNINEYVVNKIGTEKCAFACNYEMSELLNRKVNIQELNNYQLIVPASTSSCTKSLKNIFIKNKINFKPQFEISTSDMIAEMLELNVGIGYLFEKTIDKYSNLKKINIDCELPDFDIFLLHKPALLSTSTQQFIKFIMNM